MCLARGRMTFHQLFLDEAAHGPVTQTPQGSGEPLGRLRGHSTRIRHFQQIDIHDLGLKIAFCSCEAPVESLEETDES
jgi:hypothetical protein